MSSSPWEKPLHRVLAHFGASPDAPPHVGARPPVDLPLMSYSHRRDVLGGGSSTAGMSTYEAPRRTSPTTTGGGGGGGADMDTVRGRQLDFSAPDADGGQYVSSSSPSPGEGGISSLGGSGDVEGDYAFTQELRRILNAVH